MGDIPQSRIVSAIRRIWLFYSVGRREAIRRSRIKRGVYLCEQCGIKMGCKDYEVDHKISLGPRPGTRDAGEADWDTWIKRLFCDADGLLIVCSPCHKANTAKQREERAS